MDKKGYLDKLKRAYMMEGEMTGKLIDLCQPMCLPHDLSTEIRLGIESILHGIKADTLRHKEIISKTIIRSELLWTGRL